MLKKTLSVSRVASRDLLASMALMGLIVLLLTASSFFFVLYSAMGGGEITERQRNQSQVRRFRIGSNVIVAMLRTQRGRGGGTEETEAG